MSSIIGYNVHPRLTYGRIYSADEKRRFFEHVERLQPKSLLFLDDFDFASEAKRRFPNIIVVWRQYQQHDGTFFRDMSAKTFFDSHIRYAENGIVISVMNEPSGYGEQGSEDDLERIAAFMAEVLGLFGRAGARCCGPEFGTGHPALNRLAELNVMWQAFKENPLNFFSMHHYGTYHGMIYSDDTHKHDTVPCRVGRHKSILKYVKDKFNYDLPILINEFGIDSTLDPNDHPEKRGWRDAGITDVQYAQQLIQAVKEIYTEPNIKGLNIFSHGNTGKKDTADDWHTHDVSFLPDFQRELEAFAKESSMVTLPAQLFPAISDPAMKPGQFKSTGNYTFVRERASKDSAEVCKLTDATVKYIPPPLLADEVRHTETLADGKTIRTWIPIYLEIDGAQKHGWVGSDAVIIQPLAEGTPPAAPAPEPTPSIATILKIHRDLLALIISETEKERTALASQQAALNVQIEALREQKHGLDNAISKADGKLAQYQDMLKDYDIIENALKAA